MVRLQRMLMTAVVVVVCFFTGGQCTGVEPDADCNGDEFVFAIPSAQDRPEPYFSAHIVASTPSTEPVDVTITVVGFGLERTLTTGHNQSVLFILPQSAFLFGTGLQNNTIVVRSSDAICVYGMVSYGARGSGSADGFMAIPRVALGKEYYVGTYQDFVASEFSISATAETTAVYIKTNLGSEMSVELNPYETFQYIGYKDAGEPDLTGTYIRADKPVAVMGAAQLAQVPVGVFNYDYLIEQMPPIDSLGCNFVMAPFLGRASGYVYRVIGTSKISTKVSISEGASVLLRAGEFYEGNVEGDVIITITTDLPVLVLQYMKGLDTDGIGDPSMVVVAPSELYATNVTFSIISRQYRPVLGGYWVSGRYYVSVTASCGFLPDLQFDDKSISETDWDHLKNDDGKICVSRVEVTEGVHTLRHPDPGATFSAMAYGISSIESFAYPVSFMLRTGCDKLYQFDSGTLTSPNYPANYPDNVNCTFTIQTNNTQGFEISFEYFSLEDHYDYLYIGTGEESLGGELSRIVGEFTGDNVPENLQITGGYVWLQLVTDGSKNSGGFALTWRPINDTKRTGDVFVTNICL